MDRLKVSAAVVKSLKTLPEYIKDQFWEEIDFACESAKCQIEVISDHVYVTIRDHDHIGLNKDVSLYVLGKIDFFYKWHPDILSQ